VSFLRRRVGSVSIASTLVLASCLVGVSVASATVTPGWECVPTTAGQAVVSGGTGNAPSCAAGTTAVLAPTYVASGVGGKPTVEFSTLNVQVVSGSGSTSGPVNGMGNLVIGYGEKPGTQTGSNNLILGYGQSYTSYGAIVGGSYNFSTGPFTDVFGESDKASGYAASVTGGIHNFAEGMNSVVTGGQKNKAKGLYSSVDGGSENVAGSASSTILGGHGNLTSTSCQAIPAAPGSC
jgi:trimeric autotransporter adhesin